MASFEQATVNVNINPQPLHVTDNIEFQISFSPSTQVNEHNPYGYTELSEYNYVQLLIVLDGSDYIITHQKNGLNIIDCSYIYEDDYVDMSSTRNRSVFVELLNHGYYTHVPLTVGSHTVQIFILSDEGDILFMGEEQRFRVSQGIIATASSTVTNGRSSTSNLSYNNGYSRNSLTPGETYYITATYNQNDNYSMSKDVGLLEMLKASTTTLLSGPSEVVVGNSVTLTIIVKENINNTVLSQGSVSIYDGNEIIQNNYTITGTSTYITFTPNTTGNHTLRAIFVYDGVEYNSSNSEVLTILVKKIPTSLTLNASPQNTTIGTPVTITGKLKKGGVNYPNVNVNLYYNNSLVQTSTTDSNGDYMFTYVPTNTVTNGTLKVDYVGTNITESCSQETLITVNKHDVTITPPTIVSYLGAKLDLTSLLVDEHGDNVTSGVVEWTLIKQESHEVNITVQDKVGYVDNLVDLVAVIVDEEDNPINNKTVEWTIIKRE